MSTLKTSLNRRQFLKSTSSLGAALTLPLLRTGTVLAQDVPVDITSMRASQLSAAIRERQVRCVEVMQAYLERIHRYNPVYNAIVSMVDDDELIKQAELADRALDQDEYWGWMHGMPHAVKDLANAKGLETSSGSRIFAGRIAENLRGRSSHCPHSCAGSHFHRQNQYTGIWAGLAELQRCSRYDEMRLRPGLNGWGQQRRRGLRDGVAHVADR